MVKEKQHVHRYYRTEFATTKTVIYRCAKEGCTHFIQEPLIIGRFCECYRCSQAFVITRKSIRAKKLHCEACSRGKYNKPKEVIQVVAEANKTLDDILADINAGTDEQEEQREQDLNKQSKGDFNI